MTTRWQRNSLACLLLSFSLSATAAEVHQHGLAEAAVVVEGEQVTIRFRAPLMDILGTEQPPADAPARARYGKRLAQVAAPQPSPAAQCEPVSASISSVDTLFPEQQAHDSHDHHDHDAHSHHQDVENEWLFSCAFPEKLNAVELPFLGIFSSLTTEVVLLLPAGQNALRLAPDETRIPLE
ncbi:MULTISPECIES: DUF2796 domain-containing protein [unclassified Alcanivorax]|nr:MULTISPECIES: DUF2796 domain-containing protein [unclassified Alcanivorax]PHR66324.1 MAG: DUF2796 domain-containing protein [Alcanivorax sp.]